MCKKRAAKHYLAWLCQGKYGEHRKKWQGRNLLKLVQDTDYLVHVPISFFFGGGVAGPEDFACATLPTTPLDFQNKI